MRTALLFRFSSSHSGGLSHLPLFIGFIWFALRDYPGSVSFAAYDRTRPWWSFIWSTLVLLLVACYIYFAFRSVLGRFPLDVIDSLAAIYLLFCFRSSLMYSRGFRRAPLPRHAPYPLAGGNRCQL